MIYKPSNPIKTRNSKGILRIYRSLRRRRLIKKIFGLDIPDKDYGL